MRQTTDQSTSLRRTIVRVPLETTWMAACSGMATSGSTKATSTARSTTPPPKPRMAVSAEVSSAHPPTSSTVPTSTALVYNLY